MLRTKKYYKFLFVWGMTILATFMCLSKTAKAADYTGHNSWDQLTTSNGISAGIYSQSQRKMTRFQHHIFSHEKEGSTTPNYLYDAYFGFKTDNNKPTWLDQVAVNKAEYVNGTNIIHAAQSSGNFSFDSYYFTPFSGTDDGSSSLVYLLLKVTNNGPTSKLGVFSQQNMHMGSDYGTKNEETSYNTSNNYLKEFNNTTGSFAIYKNLVAQNQAYQAGNGTNVPRTFLDNNADLNNTAQQTGDDLVAGFENKDVTLATGQSKWFGVVIGLREDGNEAALAQTVDANAQTALQQGPEALLKQEETWWQNWHAHEQMPAGMTAQEQATYRQSTAVLKMSQVREKGTGNGQVLASLIPGEWSTAWVRDGSYSIKALIDSGHYQEAKAALNFFLNAAMRKDSSGDNYYQKNYLENSNQAAPTYGLNTKLSANYLLSVCRYFGDGSEDSDYNDQGPNIEFDGWGLVLWVLNDYVKKTGDYSFLLNNPQVLSAQKWIDRKQQIVNDAQSKLEQAQNQVDAKKTADTQQKDKQTALITSEKAKLKAAQGWIERKKEIVKTAKVKLKQAQTQVDKEKARAWLQAKKNELTQELNKQNQVIATAKQQIETAKQQIKQAQTELVTAVQNKMNAATWLAAKKAELTKEKNKQEPIIQAGIKNTNWGKITAQDADLLTELVDKKTGLIQPDSSIWEEHWTPFTVLKNAPARQQFAFTNITAWAGLNSAAEMAKGLGLTDYYHKYTAAADSLKTAVTKNLVVTEDGNQIIASSLERKGDSAHQNDGSTVEAINTGMVAPNSTLAQGMITAFNANLRIKTGSTPGYMRDQDGDLYDSREWGFIDLRIAGALAKMGQKSQAKVLLDWMTSQAQANYELIPELLDYNTQDYAGSVPMGGFGSGSYVLALNDYYSN